MHYRCNFCNNKAEVLRNKFYFCESCISISVNDYAQAEKRAMRSIKYFQTFLEYEFKNHIKVKFMPIEKLLEGQALGYFCYSEYQIDDTWIGYILIRDDLPRHAFDYTFAHEIVHVIIAENKGEYIDLPKIEEGLADFIGRDYMLKSGRKDRMKRIEYASIRATNTDPIYGDGIRMVNALVSEHGLMKTFHDIISRNFKIV